MRLLVKTKPHVQPSFVSRSELGLPFYNTFKGTRGIFLVNEEYYCSGWSNRCLFHEFPKSLTKLNIGKHLIRVTGSIHHVLGSSTITPHLVGTFDTQDPHSNARAFLLPLYRLHSFPDRNAGSGVSMTLNLP